jgi:hypothetical protein
MGRFDRDDTTADGPPGSVDNATEGLRSAIERQVQEIIAAAQANAAEIEDRALQTASAIELESRRRADELLKDALERASRMLATIDSLEGAISGNVASLRAEAESLTQALESARPGDVTVNEIASPPAPVETAPPDQTPPPAPEEPPPPAPEEQASVAGQASADEPRESTSPPSSTEPEAAPNPGPGNEIRVLLAAQIRDMRQAGHGREEAERFLMRFKQGENHVDLLDEIYASEDQQSTEPEQSSPKGLRRRRKR